MNIYAISEGRSVRFVTYLLERLKKEINIVSSSLHGLSNYDSYLENYQC